MDKQQIIDALRAWIRQRPGLEFGNYGDVSTYRSKLRTITKDLHHARQLLRAVELRDSITAADLTAAFRAYSGRMTIKAEAISINGVSEPCADCGVKPGKEHRANCKGGNHLLVGQRVKLDYCTGQYWPTEYRKVVCAIAASALWERKRQDMPAPRYVLGDGVKFGTEKEAREYAETMHREQNCVLGIEEKYDNLSAGDWIRRSFRREYGRGIAARWFS